MEHNPYVAPQAIDLRPGTSTTQPQPWAVGEVLEQAWTVYKQHWPPMLGALILGYIVMFGAQFGVTFGLTILLRLAGPGPGNDPATIVAVVSVAVSVLVSSFIQIGWTRMALSAARGQAPEIGDLFSGIQRTPVMVGAALLISLAVFGGMLLLVVPGIIVALGMVLAQLLIADTELGPIEALKASWQATTGHKGQLFVLGLALLLLNIGGAIACGIGMLATIPTSLIALAIVYTRLTGRLSAESAND